MKTLLILSALALTSCAMSPGQWRALGSLGIGSLERRGAIDPEDAQDLRDASEILFTSAKETREVVP